MYDFIVLTAAITRPDLHDRVFPLYLRFMQGVSVKWLINLDEIAGTSTTDETIDNLDALLEDAPNVDVEFLHAPGKGCFFSASRRLAARAMELLPRTKTGVLWLEDDWVFNRKAWLIRFLMERKLRHSNSASRGQLLHCAGLLEELQARLDAFQARGHPQWYFSLVPRALVSFNPGIWSKALFVRAFEKLTDRADSDIDDPETICADPFNQAPVDDELTLFVDPLFQDAGRRWNAQKGLPKWEKNGAQLQQDGAVSYAGPRGRIMPGDDTQDRLNGYVLLPDLLLHSPIKLIAKVRQGNDGLRARLLAVPFLSLELYVMERWKADVYIHRSHPHARTYPFRKTSAQVAWNFDNGGAHPASIEVTSPFGNFTADCRNKLPWRALWMVPMQAIAGLVVYVRDLFTVTRGLERS